MLKQNSLWSPGLSLSSEFPANPLPFIEQRKQSLLAQEQGPYPHRSKHNSLHESTDPQTFNDKLIKKDNPCIVQREINNYKKKIVIVAAKNPLHQKLYETMEEACLRTQIKLNKNIEKNRSLFASVHKASEKPNKVHISNQKSANRIYIYQTKKKTPNSKVDTKLKPIISESHFNHCGPYFLNVQKMVLIEGQRNKKSQSVIVNNFSLPEERSPPKVEKFLPNSQLIKEINIIKEKFNIQRILSMNEEIQEDREQNLHNFINIKGYESKGKETCKTQHQREKEETTESIEKKMNKVLEVMQASQETKRQKKEKFREKYNILPQSDGLVTKKNQSPAKKRRRFNVPFETYHYRDLLWKVNYTNSLSIQVPLQYEHRLKVFVGKGNNSCMVIGLISRRHWYAFTDRIEQANFVWTQLKLLQFYKKQSEFTEQIIQMPSEDGMYQSESILTTIDSQHYQNYMNTYFNSEEHSDERLNTRSKAFRYRKSIKAAEIKDTKMQNHLINNYVIGNKKALFNTMTNYYKETNQEVFDHLPLTFHIKEGLEDKKYFEFLRYYHKRAKEVNRNNQDKGKEKQYNAWIVKPGENSNRGNGIKVCLTLQEIKAVLKIRQTYNDGSYRTYIIQAYIEKPLLYFKRKFDLRHYIMITSINGIMKGYWYKDGYVRTTSSEYSLSQNDGGIHLTNDAVQKQLPDYGKFQKGNKISYDELNSYIEKYHKKKGVNFYEDIYPKMKKMATDTIRACSGGIDPSKLQNNFEIFGMDFMIDANLNVWLIQVNSNPCLELSCPLLASLIPKMVENSLELTLDAMFPPPVRYSPKGVHYFKQLEKQNKYQLVYDQRVERLYKGSLEFLDSKLLEEEDDTFQDCGDDWEDC